jgi:hypothetical protein
MRLTAAELRCDFLWLWEALCDAVDTCVFLAGFFADELVSAGAEMHSENSNAENSTDLILTT